MTEQKNVDLPFKDSEDRYRRLVEFCPEPIFMHSEGNVIYGNPAFFSAIGANSKEQVIGKPITTLVHPDYHAVVNERAKQLEIQGELPPIEYKLVRLDGEVRDFELSTMAMMYGDQLVFQVLGKDITERKQMELDLRRNNEHMQNIFASVDVAIWSFDHESRTLFCSAGIEKIKGWSAEWLMDNPSFWRTLVHPEDTAKIQQAEHELMNGHPTVVEYRIIHSSGDVRWVQDRIFPIINDAGKPVRFDGVVIDITQRKKDEQAARDSEAKYRLMADNMTDFISILDPTGNFVYASPSHQKRLGFDPLAFDTRSAFNLIDSNDHEAVFQKLNEILTTKEVLKAEFRLIDCHGQKFDVEAQGTPLLDPNGEVERIVVVTRDISERKQAEADLKKIKEQLEMILNTVDVAIWAIDLNQSHMYVSQGIQMISGYEPKQFEHYPSFWKNFIHADDVTIYDEFCHHLRLGRICQREYRIFDRSGRIRWLNDRGYPILDASGKVVGMNGVTADITMRKEAEISLRNSEERYRLLQTSLDRFSKDVSLMMKVSDLEDRLIQEIHSVVQHASVCVLEVNQQIKVKRGNCELPLNLLQESVEYCTSIGELHNVQHYGTLIKIGERKDTVYLLWIGHRPDLIDIFPKKVWLETITRYVSVWYENLHRIEDLTIELEQLIQQKRTPSWLLRLLFQVSERERKRLSIDLHDSALQEQIVWYRRMEPFCSDPRVPEDIQKQLKLVYEGMHDVIYQIRLTCNELRPSFLNHLGIVPSLEGLFRDMQLRSDYQIDFDATQLQHSLNAEQALAIYRIVQELLNNATKHSKASKVQISLSSDIDGLQLRYQDNGIGMSNMFPETHHMGLYGIRERVRSLEGSVDFNSLSGAGLHVMLWIPLVQQNTQINIKQLVL